MGIVHIDNLVFRRKKHILDLKDESFGLFGFDGGKKIILYMLDVRVDRMLKAMKVIFGLET